MTKLCRSKRYRLENFGTALNLNFLFTYLCCTRFEQLMSLCCHHCSIRYVYCFIIISLFLIIIIFYYFFHFATDTPV